MEPSERVAVPHVAGSPASIECRLHCTIELGDSTLVLGDVVAVTVRLDAIGDDSLPVAAALQPCPGWAATSGASRRRCSGWLVHRSAQAVQVTSASPFAR
jgi:flavin reductase (DIM6/NTAB) family NADH-FMN oxidoreductase RutF